MFFLLLNIEYIYKYYYIKFRSIQINKACKTYYKNLAINYSEICDELGNPEEIVADYYSNCDSSYLTKNLRFTCYIRRMFIAVFIAFIIVTGVRSFYLHELYVQSQKEIPNLYIETIE